MKALARNFLYVLKFSLIKAYNLIAHIKAYHDISVDTDTGVEDHEKPRLKSHLAKYQLSRPIGPCSTVCFAPSKSVYFGFGGKVVPCCFNRTYVYGVYPQQSVGEIINNRSRKELQKSLSSNNFSNGCEHCRRQIMDGNFNGVEARLYDKLKGHKDFPTEMIFELDNNCNLECVMCTEVFSSTIHRINFGNAINPSPYNSDFILQLKPYLKHLKVAKFLGGEPFLIKMYYEIWQILIKENPHCVIELQTNGTVFNSQIEELLGKGRFQIGVSIDSLIPEKFEQIRKNASFNQVISNLERFIKLTSKRGEYVNVSVCPMQQNWEEIPDILRFCNKRNIFICFNTVYTQGFAIQEMNSDMLLKVLQHYKKAKIRINSYISWRNTRAFNDLISQIERWLFKKTEAEKELIPRWPFMREELLTPIKLKLGSDYEIYEKMLAFAVSGMPEEMLLNDKQKQMLADIKPEDLIYFLKNESPDSLKQRLINFLQKTSFDLD
ncbi:MAG: radical SAM protein [Bacteroidales bacterium]|nr:radical SAM protein [Bacteroidales bacterium]